MFVRTQSGNEEQHFEFHKIDKDGELSIVACIEYLGRVVENYKERLAMTAFRETIQPHKKSVYKDIFSEAVTQEENARAQKIAAMAFLEALIHYCGENARDGASKTEAAEDSFEPRYVFFKEKIDYFYVGSHGYIRNHLDNESYDVKCQKNFMEYMIFSSSGDPVLKIISKKEDEELFTSSIKQTIRKLSTTDFDFRKMLGSSQPKNDIS